jgi:hypothetical protein
VKNLKRKRNGFTWPLLGQGRVSPSISLNRIGQNAWFTLDGISVAAGSDADIGIVRVFDLKVALRELTTVPEERQKILGLVKGKLPPDQERMYVPCFCIS